jgi:mRNA-degrading endonuclease YafQ of YafQ-DinJ toxin-antitoxin module
MNTKTDTPRTDEAWAAWPYAGPGISVHFGRELERELKAVTEQRDRLAEALQLFLNRVQYNSVFMDGKLRGGTFDYRSSGFDDEVTQAYEALQSLTTNEL